MRLLEVKSGIPWAMAVAGWLPFVLGAGTFALWFAYLTITRRLPNQPFRKWDMFLVGLFLLFNVVLIQSSLHILAITEIHQRRNFGANAMFAFVIPSFLVTLVFNSRKE